MKDDKRAPAGQPPQPNGSLPNRILGSLRDALNAASRDDRTGEMSLGGGTDRVSGKAPPGGPEAGRRSRRRQPRAGDPRRRPPARRPASRPRE